MESVRQIDPQGHAVTMNNGINTAHSSKSVSLNAMYDADFSWNSEPECTRAA